MKKEDFKYGAPEYYINDKYVIVTTEYLLVINSEIFNEETIEYANKIIKKYIKEKEEILNYMLDIRLRKFYNLRYNYSDEYIKNNIGRPQINILDKKDEKHPNWKFEYLGSIEFVENKLDNHIIIIDFLDDLKLREDIQIDG